MDKNMPWNAEAGSIPDRGTETPHAAEQLSPQATTTVCVLQWKIPQRGLPWWLSGRESVCQCRRSIPGPGRSHVPQSNSPGTTAIEPVLKSPANTTTEPIRRNYWILCPRVDARQQEKPPAWEAWVPRLESSPHSLQLEKSLHSKKDPARPKINK